MDPDNLSRDRGLWSNLVVPAGLSYLILQYFLELGLNLVVEEIQQPPGQGTQHTVSCLPLGIGTVGMGKARWRDDSAIKSTYCSCRWT